MTGVASQFDGGLGGSTSAWTGVLAILRAMHSTNVEAYGAGTLTHLYSAVALTIDAADINSETVPDHCRLSALDMAFSNVLQGAVTCTFYLSEDAAGLYPLTHPVTREMYPGRTNGHYVISYRCEREYRRSAAGTIGTVYLQSYLNADSADLIVRLRFQP